METHMEVRSRGSKVDFPDPEEGNGGAVELDRSPLARRRRWLSKKCILLVLGVAAIALATWYYRTGTKEARETRPHLVYYDNEPNVYGLRPRLKYDPKRMAESVRLMKMGETEVVMPKPEVTCIFYTPTGDRGKVLAEGETIRSDYGEDCIQCTQCTAKGMNCTILRNTRCKGH